MRVNALAGPSLALLVGSAFVPACDGEMPRPRYTQQKTAALVQVGYPPPPAGVEFIPARPQGDTVWLDGEWGWTGSRWAWTAGSWVLPPPGATFSPWTTIRDDQGTVYFASGAWVDATGQPIPPPPPLARGRARAVDIRSPEDDENGVARAAPSAPSSTAPHP